MSKTAESTTEDKLALATAVSVEEKKTVEEKKGDAIDDVDSKEMDCDDKTKEHADLLAAKLAVVEAQQKKESEQEDVVKAE